MKSNSSGAGTKRLMKSTVAASNPRTWEPMIAWNAGAPRPDAISLIVVAEVAQTPGNRSAGLSGAYQRAIEICPDAWPTKFFSDKGAGRVPGTARAFFWIWDNLAVARMNSGGLAQHGNSGSRHRSIEDAGQSVWDIISKASTRAILPSPGRDHDYCARNECLSRQ